MDCTSKTQKGYNDPGRCFYCDRVKKGRKKSWYGNPLAFARGEKGRKVGKPTCTSTPEINCDKTFYAVGIYSKFDCAHDMPQDLCQLLWESSDRYTKVFPFPESGVECTEACSNFVKEVEKNLLSWAGTNPGETLKFIMSEPFLVRSHLQYSQYPTGLIKEIVRTGQKLIRERAGHPAEHRYDSNFKALHEALNYKYLYPAFTPVKNLSWEASHVVRDPLSIAIEANNLKIVKKLLQLAPLDMDVNYRLLQVDNTSQNTSLGYLSEGFRNPSRFIHTALSRLHEDILQVIGAHNPRGMPTEQKKLIDEYVPFYHQQQDTPLEFLSGLECSSDEKENRVKIMNLLLNAGATTNRIVYDNMRCEGMQQLILGTDGHEQEQLKQTLKNYGESPRNGS
eukprot:g2194.t1